MWGLLDHIATIVGVLWFVVWLLQQVGVIPNKSWLREGQAGKIVSTRLPWWRFWLGIVFCAIVIIAMWHPRKPQIITYTIRTAPTTLPCPIVSAPTPQVHHLARSAASVKGEDNTVLSRTPVNVQGNGNTVVGPTDANGNTILNKGGLAAGFNSCADQNSIAIGANARAGNCVPTNAASAPNGIANAGGTLINPTVNNFGPPKRMLTEKQAASMRAAVQAAIGDYAPVGFNGIVCPYNDTEACALARQINSALGWGDHLSYTMFAGQPYGIKLVLSTEDASSPPPQAIALAKIIRDAGLEVIGEASSLQKGHWALSVGSVPQEEPIFFGGLRGPINLQASIVKVNCWRDCVNPTAVSRPRSEATCSAFV